MLGKTAEGSTNGSSSICGSMASFFLLELSLCSLLEAFSQLSAEAGVIVGGVVVVESVLAKTAAAAAIAVFFVGLLLFFSESALTINCFQICLSRLSRSSSEKSNSSTVCGDFISSRCF
jgi:hypothetical protein